MNKAKEKAQPILTPTIGILPSLEGLDSSGKIIVMTDSDCVDTNAVHYASPYHQNAGTSSGTFHKCFWLLHKFADIATGKAEASEATTELLSKRLQLPHDYLSGEYAKSGAIKTETLEDYQARMRMSGSLQRKLKVKLNSDR